VCLSVVRSVTRYSEEGACEHKQDDAAATGCGRDAPAAPIWLPPEYVMVLLMSGRPGLDDFTL
jgi:hypothetical protein